MEREEKREEGKGGELPNLTLDSQILQMTLSLQIHPWVFQIPLLIPPSPTPT